MGRDTYFSSVSRYLRHLSREKQGSRFVDTDAQKCYDIPIKYFREGFYGDGKNIELYRSYPFKGSLGQGKHYVPLP